MARVGPHIFLSRLSFRRASCGAWKFLASPGVSGAEDMPGFLSLCFLGAAAAGATPGSRIPRSRAGDSLWSRVSSSTARDHPTLGCLSFVVYTPLGPISPRASKKTLVNPATLPSPPSFTFFLFYCRPTFIALRCPPPRLLALLF